MHSIDLLQHCFISCGHSFEQSFVLRHAPLQGVPFRKVLPHDLYVGLVFLIHNEYFGNYILKSPSLITFGGFWACQSSGR